MSKKKEIIFMYLDKYGYTELIETDDNWLEPNDGFNNFGYEITENILYYNGKFFNEIILMFGVELEQLRLFFKEWFSKRYKLTVTLVI